MRAELRLGEPSPVRGRLDLAHGSSNASLQEDTTDASTQKRDAVLQPKRRFRVIHFFAGGYLARSACHCFVSSGLFVIVYSSIKRSTASGRSFLDAGGIAF